MERTDILIAGGGIAGMSAAARFAADGWHVTIVDPAPAQPACSGDLRTTAFLQPAITTLTRAGAWERMSRDAAALRVMRIVDAGGAERAPRETQDFLGTEAGHDLFGWNVSNVAARNALLEVLADLPNVIVRDRTRVIGIVTRMDTALVRLSDGTQISARLVVGADGRDSAVREMSGIKVRRWQYNQSALVFAVRMNQPHGDVSTEIHRTGGPLTLVPMPDQDGQPHASIVWLSPHRRAAELNALDDAALSAELTAETMGLHGPLTVASPRAVWPMMAHIAARMTASRVALIAEAAHVMPPIGAQGLNTSLSDIETLAGLITGSPDPGERSALRRYEARQLPLITGKVCGVDLLNRASMAEAQPLRDLRRAGLSLIARSPLRRLAIRAGLGG